MRRTCLAVVFAAGCYAAASPRLSLPFYSQEKNGCGAASVAMVMRYWENQRPEPTLSAPSPMQVYESLYRPEQKGIRLADMETYLDEMGFRAFALHGEWTDVEEQLAKGRPLIVGLKEGRKKAMHFVVVAGVDGGLVWLNDPTRKKPNRMKQADFEKRWALADRWMLLAAPAAGSD